MATVTLREQLQTTLQTFEHGSLKDNALALLDQLGYRSDKQLDLEPNTAATFIETFGQGPEHLEFKTDKALVDEWLSVDFLFQLAGDDLAIGGQLPLVRSNAVDTSAVAWQSYLFFAIRLRERERPYTRTELANITREVNKLFLMPVMPIFQHGQTITLSVINRRLNKRYPEQRDVLEKVTLLKDINVRETNAAHLRILEDLASDELHRVHKFATFEGLHQAWQKTLDISELNKRFFQEVATWYFWAIDQVAFPKGLDGRNSNEMSLIRLITRLIFVWFLKEKELVPDRLFNPRELRDLLKSVKDSDSTYYWAILQNLFFATLNQEADKRQFCDNTKFHKGYNPNRLSTNLYRHQDLFRAEDEAEILGLFQDIPFLNGGLFECLDEEVKRDSKTVVKRVDGFSRNPKEAAQVPNKLFFQEDPLPVDLNATYHTKGKRYTVRGLLPILNSYKFTVTENTPIEEEIALDPELLGKVFENLLAAYNPETETTARKKTGSFYTPREVVDYMVDESLLTYFKSKIVGDQASEAELTELDRKLRRLVDYGGETNPFADDSMTNIQLIAAINQLKALDPAVGSGAFPMGMLQKLVMILRKLDPENRIWKHEQREKLIGDKEREIKKDVAIARQISDEEVRETAIQQLQERLERLEAEFANQDWDYPRKLFLIENCIYGVDIQNIAVQIAKLRCFIALIVEQTVDDHQPNRGIFPLPNLEMKFVAANTLFALEKAEQLSLLGSDIALKEKETELEQLRHDYFQTYDLGKKRRLKEKDEALRAEIAILLQSQNVSKSSAEKIAYWNPYDQLAEADFFDPHWMFGIEDGFDIVIGNPPYGARITMSDKQYFKSNYLHQDYQLDTYLLFIERSLHLVEEGGSVCLIIPNTWISNLLLKRIRRFLFKNEISSILHFLTSIFAAVVDTEVLLVRKKPVPKEHKLKVLCFTDDGFQPHWDIHQSDWKVLDGEPVNIFARGETSRVIKKIRNFQDLEEICGIKQGCKPFQSGKGKPPQTKDIVRQKPYVSASKENETFRPLLRGKLIGKYSILWSNNYYISFGDWLAEPRYSANYDAPEKILVRQTGDSLIATLDTQKFIVRDNLYSIFPKTPNANLRYILGCINSKILNWFYQNSLNPEQGEALAQVKRGHLAKLPIPSASASDQAAITALVQKCLDAKGQDVAHWEAEIDDRMGRLYGLTSDDLKIIHGD